LFFDALQNDPRTDNKEWVGEKCSGNNQSPRAGTAPWDKWLGRTIVMPARPLIPPGGCPRISKNEKMPRTGEYFFCQAKTRISKEEIIDDN